jgi:hypothetical protein
MFKKFEYLIDLFQFIILQLNLLTLKSIHPLQMFSSNDQIFVSFVFKIDILY